MIDLANKDQLLTHLRNHGLTAQKRFGQNFLIDDHILNQIVKAADLNESDTVVEVGPGPGVLSQRLAPHIQSLISVEIDPFMISPWQDLMKDFPHAEIFNQDVLDFQSPTDPYKLVANIPYYITSPILKHFLRHQDRRRPDMIVLMIQKEVAQRICDKKKPTLLSWEIRLFGEPRVACKVPPSSFFPSPKVDSAVLCIDVYDKPLIEPSEMTAFFDFLSIAYKQPRKTLSNNLLSSGKYSKEELYPVLEECQIDEKSRPHQLSLENWKLLTTRLTS